jgi:hypothetical protein
LPRQHIAAVPIHDRHQVDKAMCQTDIRDIRRPDLIWASDCQVPQQVRLDGMRDISLAGFGARIHRHQPHHS